MSRHFRIVVIATLSLSTTAAAEAEDLSAKQALEHWGAAFKKADVDNMMRHYDVGNELVVVMSSGKMLRGSAAVREAYVEAFREVVFEEVRLKSLQVRQHDDFATAICRFEADTKLKTDASGWRLQIQTSLALRKTDDGWKITLEHSSPLQDVPRVERR